MEEVTGKTIEEIGGERGVLRQGGHGASLPRRRVKGA
jgi:hypothetical protein